MAATPSTRSDARTRVRTAWTAFTPGERLALVCLVALLGLLVVSRFLGLGLSLWQDEVVTVADYVLPGPDGIWFGRYTPNNHVFFNLITWLTTLALGSGEAVLRLWAVIPALAATAVLAWWSWRRLGPAVSVVVTLLATTAPRFLQLHTEARGYGLTTLAAVLMIVVSDRLLREQSDRRHWLAYGGAALLGIWTHLAFVVGYAAQSLTLFVLGRLRRGVLVTGLCVALASALFYAPLLGQMANALPRTFSDAGSQLTEASYAALEPSAPGTGARGQPKAGTETGTDSYPSLPWHAPLTGPLRLLAPSVELLVLGRDRQCDSDCYSGLAFVVVVPVLVFWLAGLVALWSQGRRRLLLLLAGPPALAFVVLTLPQGYVADRFVSYTMPYTLVLVGAGIIAVVQRLSAVRFARPPLLAAAGLLTVVGLAQFAGLVDRRSRLPWENARQVARVIDRSGAGPVYTNSVRPEIFFYYLGRDGVRVRRQPEMVRATLCSAPEPYTFVYHRHRARPVDLSCLAKRRAELVRVHQRGRGNRIDVYFVEGPAPS